MGLRERQLVREFKEEKLPSYSAQLVEVTGGAQIAWDVDWDSFVPSEKALMYFDSQGLSTIVNAIRHICYNDLGKEAVREGLHTIEIKNFSTPGDLSVTFGDGTLVVHGAWAADSGGFPNEREVQRVLEDGL